MLKHLQYPQDGRHEVDVQHLKNNKMMIKKKKKHRASVKTQPSTVAIFEHIA